MSNFIKFFFLCFLSFFLIANSVVQAGIIQQVKNDKVLMTLDDAQVQIGDQFYGINSDKKKTSVLEITTIKNLKAVAKIIKGTAQVNDTTEKKPISTILKSGNSTTPTVPATQKNASVSKNNFIRYDRSKFAVNLLMSADKISTKQTDTQPLPQSEDVDLTGNNFGIAASIDVQIIDWVDLRAFAGYEILKVKATSQFLSCAGKSSTDCNADINYLSFGGIIRFKYIKDNFEYWGGLGASIKQPLTKKSTALKEPDIARANTLIGAIGLDYYINNNYFVPVSFEYHKSFNESETVPVISHNVVTLGFGFMF